MNERVEESGYFSGTFLRTGALAKSDKNDPLPPCHLCHCHLCHLAN